MPITDVRVVDLGQKPRVGQSINRTQAIERDATQHLPHFGSSHWILLWQEELELEQTSLKGGLIGAFDDNVKVA